MFKTVKDFINEHEKVVDIVIASVPLLICGGVAYRWGELVQTMSIYSVYQQLMLDNPDLVKPLNDGLAKIYTKVTES